MTSHSYDQDEKRRRLDDKLRRELGPVVSAALDDPRVVEVMLNPDGKLWEDRLGLGMKEIGSMLPSQAISLICTVASALGTDATRDAPIVEGELPTDGSRFEGLIPPIVEGPTFSIRKKAILIYTLDDYVRDGIITPAQKEEIDRAIEAKKNILVVGSTGSGKTTLCNAILHRTAELDPHTRVAIIEDTRELQCHAVNKVSLRTSEAANMETLLRACMRLRPERIVVGEVRDKAALALIKAWNTGHSGGVATVHANSAESGLTRIEQLIQESGVQPIKEVVAEAINYVISIQRTNQGRRVEQIMRVNFGTPAGYDMVAL